MSDTELDLIETSIDEPRVPASGEGHLSFIRGSATVTVAAAVIEISRSTLLLEADESIEPGVRVELELQSLSVRGEVRSCRAIAPDRYRLGVRFTFSA